MKNRLYDLCWYEYKRNRIIYEVVFVIFLVVIYFLFRSNISQDLLEFNYHFKDAITFCSIDQYYLLKILIAYSRSFLLLVILIVLSKIYNRSYQKEKYLPLSWNERFIKGFVLNLFVLSIILCVLFGVLLISLSINLSNYNWSYISITYNELVKTLIWQNVLFIAAVSLLLEGLAFFLLKNKYWVLLFIFFLSTDKSLIVTPGYTIYLKLDYECHNRQ